MKKYKVKTDIKLPKSTRNNKYGFPELEVNESIAVETKMEARAFRTWGTNRGYKVSERALTENKKQVIRLWRTA